ncbi:MAG: DUF4314 domain-containing protein [Ruminococcus sp.]|nr:DUF4314 domain-containing protein [Ruminococcus sp.]
MKNSYPSRAVVEDLKAEYPPKAIVILDNMQDPQAPTPGTAGEVLSVDDIGTIHVSWLTGGTLGVAYGEVEIHKASPHEVAVYRIAKEAKRQKANPDSRCFCPRCGDPMNGIRKHVLSRRADIIICDSCGTQESMEDAVSTGIMKGAEALPIEKWVVAKGAYHIYAEEDDENGYTISIPETGEIGHCKKLENIITTGEKIHKQ